MTSRLSWACHLFPALSPFAVDALPWDRWQAFAAHVDAHIEGLQSRR